MENYDYLFKIIIIGDSNVGKSSLMIKFTTKQFRGNQYDPTIGVEFGSKMLDIQQRKIKLQIWDTAGQESFRSITRSYYRWQINITNENKYIISSVGAILVFDLSNLQSFENIQKWVEETKQHGYEKMTYILVGNKSDLQKERQVNQSIIDQYISQNQFYYLDTSAKLGTNVDNVFKELSDQILNKIINKDLDPLNEINCGVKIGDNKNKKEKVDYQNINKQLNTQLKKKKQCC